MSLGFLRFDAYIAAARPDEERVASIARRLRAAGLEVRLREEIFLPGDKVFDRINSVISQSRVGLVVFSRAAESDGWFQEVCRAFIRRSIELDHKFIPVLIDDAVLPDLVSNWEPSDLRDDAAPDYEERIARLIEAIRDEEAGRASAGVSPSSEGGGGDASRQPQQIPPWEIEAEQRYRMLLLDIESELGDAVAPAELPMNRIRWAWRSALGALAPPLTGSVRDSRDLIREAADVVLPADQPPALLSVAEYIAAASHPMTAGSIRRCIARLAERYSLALPRPVTVLGRLGSGSILVRLLPSAPGSKRYQVTVSTFSDLTGSAEPLECDEIAKPIGMIKSRLGRVISEALKRVDDSDGTTLIEFLLPRDLLREPVEDWHLEKTVQKMGSLYPVVVRDMQWPDFVRGKSLARWGRLLQAQPFDDGLIKRLTCTEPLTAHQLRDWFELYASHVVLVLPFEPSRSRGWDMLDAAFATGVPVVVWPRLECRCSESLEGICPGWDFGDDFVRRINGEPVRELPWLVKRFRNEATLHTAATSHCGRGLVLLWHDPHRKIDDLPLLNGPRRD